MRSGYRCRRRSAAICLPWQFIPTACGYMHGVRSCSSWTAYMVKCDYVSMLTWIIPVNIPGLWKSGLCYAHLPFSQVSNDTWLSCLCVTYGAGKIILVLHKDSDPCSVQVWKTSLPSPLKVTYYHMTTQRPKSNTTTLLWQRVMFYNYFLTRHNDFIWSPLDAWHASCFPLLPVFMLS